MDRSTGPLRRAPVDTSLGVPGDYEASLIPTVPGDYTFHLTGSIHGQAVDETATSSDSTFNPAVESTEIQFPTKLPSLTEITTRLDRIDARLTAGLPPVAASTSPALNDTTAGLADAVVAAQAAASQAQRAASTSLVVGIIVGALGIVLGGTALALTRRDRGRA